MCSNHRLLIGSQVANVHFSIFACCSCGPTDISLQDVWRKQTHILCPFLGSGQSVVIPRSRGFVASVMFYLKVSHSYILKGHAGFHELINEVMLLHLLTHALPPSCSCTRMLGCVYWCGYETFLAILLLWNPRTKVSFLAWLVIQSLSEVECAANSVCSGARHRSMS